MSPESQPQTSRAGDDERTLGEYLVIIWRSRRLVAACALACGILGLLYGVLRTRTYRSTALLVPPGKGQGAGVLAQFAAANPGLASLAGSLGVEGSSPRTYTEILGSRKVMEAVAEKHQLAEVYSVESKYLAAGVLGKRADHSVTRGGLIAVSVVDPSPELAAQLANSFSDKLNSLLGELDVTQASLERDFLEKRLGMARKELAASEEALRDFQEKNKAVGLTETARAGIGIYADLKAQLIARETMLSVVRTYKAPQDHEVLNLESGIEALRIQLAALEAPRTYARDPATGNARPEPGQAIVHLDEVPEMSLKYARLLRGFRIQQQLFEYLTMQLEAARIQEARDAPACQVLQRAEPSEKPSDMRTRNMIAGGLFIGLALGALVGVMWHEMTRARS
jgi:uncharacterized protein involved in exopolysaccharide biosynthesis